MKTFPVEAKFSYPDNGYPADRTHARRFLTPGKVYGVREMQVGQSSSYLTLYEVPGERFNSVMFEPWWDSRALAPGDVIEVGPDGVTIERAASTPVLDSSKDTG